MRLKSLELQGFKSFPDKTVLQFTSGITAVLGPNGSGKSNISDAVRWVLGELSSKNLRGTKMEDVIFGGSDTRRPMGYAEVTLVLDNTGGTGHLASEHDEVTVTRRYYRSGTSEYLINRRTVRLRDIGELFLNTGLGKSGYSIIGQGKIAEIISQKSEDRRRIFEEAAGIAKYRYQKAEAEKKLTEVDENCRNLSGILGELTKRVNQLERDSEKARVYLELFGEKKQVDVALWLSDVDQLRVRYEDAQKKYLSAKIGLDSADSENAELERQESGLYTLLSDCQTRMEENERALGLVRGQNRELESAARVLENDLRHSSETLEKTKTEVQIRSASLAEEKKREEKLTQDLCLREQAFRDSEEKAAALAEKQQALLQDTKRLEAEQDRAEQQAKTVQEALAELDVRISSLEGSHLTDADRRKELDAQKLAQEQEQTQLSDRMQKAERAMDGYTRMSEEARATLQKSEDQLAQLDKACEQSRAEQSRLIAELSSKRQRADALKRMDELFEGYAQSVRALMNAAEQKKLNGICGPIARLIRVEPKYVLAIETALGANLQNIVVEDEESAKAAIAFLKKNNAGRCTFYPITSVRPATLNLSQAERRALPGYLGVGDEICNCDSRFAAILSSMLGRTLVFDHLDHATAAARSTGYRFRMVTLDGQIINSGGSFTGGSSRRESGMLTRSSEIDRLYAEADHVAAELAQEKERFSERQSEMTAIREKNANEEGQINLFNTLCQAEKTQYEVLKSQHDTVTARLQELLAGMQALDEKRESFSQVHDALCAEREQMQATLGELREQETTLTREYASADDSLSVVSAAYQALLLEKASIEKDVEVLRQAVAFSRAGMDALLTQIAEANASIERLTEKQIEIRSALAENGAGATDLSGEEAQLAQKGRALVAEKMQLEQKQTALREQIREKAHVREVLFRDVTRLETGIGQMKSDLDSMATRLWEEYELTYSSASALGYPPVTDGNRVELTARREELRQKIKKLGSVNPASIEEYQTEKERFDFLSAQLGDLTASRKNLSEIVTDLEKEMHVRFLDALGKIGTQFRSIFRELFGGGNAEIRLTDPEHALECGIEINAAPPGKIIKSMTLLSGGEQSFTAIALIFAILKVNPTPFCIFDEIEAALDEVNVGQFAQYMRRYADTQFIVITHRRGTMEAADRIYGVSMPERGISKVLCMDVAEIEAKLGASLT